MTKNIALILAASLLLAANVARAEQNVTHKPHHASLSCQTCHGDTENKVPPANEACLTCHGPMSELIKKTSDYKRNPHYSPHWGDTVDCYTCHKEHKASEISCATQYCHVKNFEGVQLK
ncbi:cytochrome c3 family protein [Mailhella massiliensis]|uniref:cytochrome c3 family protein n=1 Tax=Mailhella massiliensis TaxID=1903261 RepID=UPI00097D3F97|nr:cytochrome c3 family protein [Mailhella massiliensis]